jgi:hypothetical protein
MTVGTAVTRGRQRALERMLDTFDIKVESAKPEYDPVTKTTGPGYTFLFSTPGRVKVGGGLAAQDAEIGGRTSVTVRRELHIPVDSAAIPANAVAVCTAVADTSDPTLLGAVLRLAGPRPGLADHRPPARGLRGAHMTGGVGFMFEHIAVTRTVRIVDGKIVGSPEIARCSCGERVDGAEAFMAHRDSVQ